MLVPLVTYLEQLSHEERETRLRRIRHDDPVAVPAPPPVHIKAKEESPRPSATPEPAPAEPEPKTEVPVLSPAKHAIVVRADSRAVITWIAPGKNLSLGLERLWEFYHTGMPGLQPAFRSVSDSQLGIDSTAAYWEPGKHGSQRLAEYKSLIREMDSISQQGKHTVEAITALCKMAQVGYFVLVNWSSTHTACRFQMFDSSVVNCRSAKSLAPMPWQGSLTCMTATGQLCPSIPF